MTSSESKEPKGSERSSTKCCCGHSGAWHPFSNGEGCTADACGCEDFEPAEHESPGLAAFKDAQRRGRARDGEQCEGGCAIYTESPCADLKDCACGGEWWKHGCQHSLPPEPPLTPEEEEERALAEEAAEAARGALEDDWAAEAPPQPERRPPYAVAYSADGHLYEVMLPGDAIVSAVDGALVIKHARFQIHGIVAVQPIESKESSP